jgi:hypothetical protein
MFRFVEMIAKFSTEWDGKRRVRMHARGMEEVP